MNQKSDELNYLTVKIVLIAMVVIFAIVAVAYLGLKKDIEFDILVEPKDKKLEMKLKTKEGPDNDKKTDGDKKIEVHQEADEVKGEMTGIKAKDRLLDDLPGSMEVEQKVGTVETGGSAVGVDLSRENVKE